MSQEYKIVQDGKVYTTVPSQVVIQQVPPRKTNGMGTAGFVLALIGLVFCWVPFLDLILSFLGFVFSFVGLFKTPVGLAIAGFIISIIALILSVVICGALIAAILGL